MLNFTPILVLRRFLLTLFFFFSSQIMYCQIKTIIIDSLTKEPIPYLSIWIDATQTNVLTDNDGFLSFPIEFMEATFVLSAAGFKEKEIKIKQTTNVIELNQKVFELEEIVVTPHSKRRRKYKTANKIQKSKVGIYLPGFNERKMFAEFFKYQLEYEKTPYLKEVHVMTKSEVQEAKFNIILFSLNENGQPDGYIYPHKIIATSKKGKQTTKIDLSHLNIPFPKIGFFVGIEWFTTTNGNEWGTIQPNIGFMQLETEMGSWYYRNGEWKKIWKNTGEHKYYKNKFNHLALELVLSN